MSVRETKPAMLPHSSVTGRPGRPVSSSTWATRRSSVSTDTLGTGLTMVVEVLSLLEAGLVDDFRLHLAPMILGDEDALPLFSGRAPLSLDEALRMASLYPSRAIGIDSELGSITPGKIANLVVFDDNYRVHATVVNGHYQEHKPL